MDTKQLQKKETIFKRRNLIISIAVTFLIALFFLFLVPARFETNDDPGMAHTIYGHYGQRSGHLVYINIIIGQVIMLCHEAFPNIAWYTVFQVAFICIAFVILLYLIFEKFGFRGIFPAIILIVYFGFEFLSRMQFTKTAGISVAAGFLLLFDAIENRRKKPGYLLGIGMIAVGSMYRFNVFLMISVLFFGVGLHILYRYIKEKSIRQILRLCIPFLAVFILCFGLKAFNSWTYQRDPQWSDYMEFNSLRSNLLDYGFPDYDENRELYDSLEISETDYIMYRNWNIADNERFRVEILQKLVDAKQKRRFDSELIHGFAAEIPRGLFGYWYITAPLIAVFACLLLFERKHLFLLVYLCISFCFVQLYFYYTGRYLQNRVDACMLFTFTMILLLYLFSGQLLNRRRVAVLLAGAVLITSIPQYKEYFSVQPPDSYEYLFPLFSSDPEHIYFATVTALPSDLFNLWDSGSVGMKSNYIVTGGWETNSPDMQRVLDSNGIENPYREVVDNPDFYFICRNGNLFRQLDYIREHYAPDANAYCVKRIDDECNIYRIATTGTPQVDIENAQRNEWDKTITYDISCESSGGGMIISGYLYAEQTNSFASNIYLGLRTADGEENLYYTTQSAADFTDDNMNGAYSVFYREIGEQSPGTAVVLYLETGDTVYCVETDISF